jgi:predicted RNA-binding protein (virulence factor B family)
MRALIQQVLEALKQSDGVLRLNDNSHPEEIKSVMKMSKKTFKKAIGSLYKQKLIDINNEGIQLL